MSTLTENPVTDYQVKDIAKIDGGEVHLARRLQRAEGRFTVRQGCSPLATLFWRWLTVLQSSLAREP